MCMRIEHFHPYFCLYMYNPMTIPIMTANSTPAITLGTTTLVVSVWTSVTLEMLGPPSLVVVLAVAVVLVVVLVVVVVVGGPAVVGQFRFGAKITRQYTFSTVNFYS